MQSDNFSQSIKPVFNLLKLTFGIVPLVAGLDKFTNLLTDWEHYLNPQLINIIPFSSHVFMMIVGVMEIIAGIIVLMKTEIGAYIVAVWLTLIALSLLIGFDYLDVAVRDLVMAISAYALARMAKFTHV